MSSPPEKITFSSRLPNKKGRFRKGLIGKRTINIGRAVIIDIPKLKHTCQNDIWRQIPPHYTNVCSECHRDWSDFYDSD